MRTLLFRLARSRFATLFIGFAFAHLTRFMPVKRVQEDAKCILFLHPVPFWQTHWLGVPKRSIPSFAQIVWCNDGPFVSAVLRQLVEASRVAGIRPKTILVNGGRYQDVPQLHFHLASGSDRHGNRLDAVGSQIPNGSTDAEDIIVLPHPAATRAFHWQLLAPSCVPLVQFVWDSAEINTLTRLLQTAQALVREHQLDAYTLQWHLDTDSDYLAAHLVSGPSQIVLDGG